MIDAHQISRHIISIHAPPRGATSSVNDGWTIKLFQFTPLREGRPNTRFSRCSASHFNSRPSARGDAVLFGTMIGLGVFQFTPLREGRPKFGRCYDERILFQFTPLREGRRCVPACRMMLCTFQFTPLREGRPVGKVIEKPGSLFQFTPLREGRHLLGVLQAYCKDISIHAPPRGATESNTIGRMPQYFNSRPSARGDSTM